VARKKKPPPWKSPPAIGYAQNPLVQVSCPTYAGKEPVLKEWWEGLKAQTYTNWQAFCVDNTPRTEAFPGTPYLAVLQGMGIPSIHIQPWLDKPLEQTTFKRCWELILERALKDGATWIWSVEADNVPAPEALDKMLDIASFAHVHLVTHDYPLHKSAAEASGMRGDEFYYTELGCMLLSTQLLEGAFRVYEHKLSSAIFLAAERYRAGWCRMSDLFEVKHLDSYETEFVITDAWDPEDKSFCPTPSVPDTFGSKLPDCLAALVKE